MIQKKAVGDSYGVAKLSQQKITLPLTLNYFITNKQHTPCSIADGHGWWGVTAGDQTSAEYYTYSVDELKTQPSYQPSIKELIH